VVLVADIDRGGVFAQIVGSLEVMPPEDRRRVCGFLVNKFRGDLRLFDDGVAYLERRTGLPVLGVVPHLYGFELDSEDAVPLTLAVDPPVGTDAEQLCIGVVRLPHISNFTDFDALARTPGVAVHYIYRPRDLTQYAAVILPGSKSVAADLAWLRASGLAAKISAYHAAGGKLVGICGGLQMLGEWIVDEQGVESQLGRVPGLGLLPAVTSFSLPKVVRRVTGALCRTGGLVTGYEIHVGRTHFDQPSPLISYAPPHASSDEPMHDGYFDEQRRLWLTYWHGVFDEAAARHAFLQWVEPTLALPTVEPTRDQWVDAQIDEFARHLKEHVDVPQILRWASGGGSDLR